MDDSETFLLLPMIFVKKKNIITKNDEKWKKY